MATQVQFRGGTTAQNNAFTGASKELTVDTDKDVVVVHDGATAGGHPLMAEDGSNSALALGSAGTPALKFTGDTNTGIYSPGADKIALSAGGTGRLFVESSGNIGIGETSPATYSAGAGLPTLVLKGNNVSYTDRSGAVGFISQDGTTGKTWMYHDTDFNIQSSTATDIRFLTSNTEVLRIDSSGRMLVGTSSTSAAVNSLFQARSNSSTGGAILMVTRGNATPADNNELGIIDFSDSGHIAAARILAVRDGGTWTSGSSQPTRLVFNTTANGSASSTERMKISSDGVMSMGDPQTNGGWRVFVADNGSANQRGRMSFRAKNGTAVSQEVLQSYLGSTETFRLRVDGGGFFGSSLGVGTASPRGTLHLHTSGATRFDLTNTATGTGSGDGTTISIDSSTGALNIIQREAQPINFSTSNTQAATIDASGRLLVGQTTQSNSSLFTIKGNTSNSAGASEITLQRGEAATAITSGESLGHLYFTDNSSNKFAEIAGFADSAAGANDFPGRLEFRTTADSASSPTTRMTIKNNGTINFANVQTFADDAAAGSGGLSSGDVYKTSAGDLKIKA
jgi:hypothetical protein